LSSTIHSTAVIEDGATIGNNVTIGAYCVIGANVVLGDNVTLKSHVSIDGYTTIGDGTTIYPFASIGHAPQDLKFKGEKTTLTIGKNNTIREHVTMNPGTEGGGGVTRVGDDGLFMAGSHVAHDCQLGDHVILVNNAALAGHCVLEEGVIVGGLSGVHQFVRIGRGAMIGAVTMVTADVVPYGLVQGPRGTLDGLNLVGLKRRGAGRADIAALRDLLGALAQGTFRDTARAEAAKGSDNALVQEVLDFILGPSDRSFLTPR